MKYILILILTTTCILKSYSQDLTGIWDGWYLSPKNKKDTVIMKLDFRLNQDSTYDVYSFTKEGDVKSVCKMSYKFLNKNSIYLEEVQLVRTNKRDVNFKLQNMKLEIEKDFKTMSGRWTTNIKELGLKGAIYFSKKKE
jgi:hypothetical protein